MLHEQRHHLPVLADRRNHDGRLMVRSRLVAVGSMLDEQGRAADMTVVSCTK
jgi:hypothetical protein